MMRIVCNTYIKKEKKMYSAVCIEFGIASCGHTIEEAYKNVIEAVTIHLNDAQELGTLDELLKEQNYERIPKNTDRCYAEATGTTDGRRFDGS